MKFGVKTGQGGYTYDELSKIWAKAEELGFDSAWLYDHFIALGNSNTPCLEAYTTLGALTRETKRLRLGVMATCAGYRNPALLGKIASTLDVISKGRLIMALGAGWYEDEYKAYGYEYLPNPERVIQLRETIKILQKMWKDTSPAFEGRYYSIKNATNIPKPIQESPPIWIGISKGTRVLPSVAVKEADGFNTMADIDLCKQIIERAETVRKELGRERSKVTYSLQAYLLTGNESQIKQLIEDGAKKTRTSPEEYAKRLKDRGCIMGPPETCAEILKGYIDAGIDYVLPIVVGDRLLWPLEVVRDRLFKSL